MQFKDVTEGHVVYVMEAGDEVKAWQGKVVKAGEAYVRNVGPGNVGTFGAQLMVDRVRDLTIELDGRTVPYTVLEMSEVSRGKTQTSEVVVALNKADILKEVEAVKAKKEEVLKNVERDKKCVKQCTEILTEWNPEFKKSVEQEKRLGVMEEKLSGMEGMIKELYNMMKS